jgi:hypothetical protein
MKLSSSMNANCDLHTLWIGPRLPWLERLCLASWVRHGHVVTLWTYQQFEGVPAGVQIRDARQILPESAITAHRYSGSFALFSNRFRYHLLRRSPVTWLDADIFLLHPLVFASSYLFARETSDSVCNAVLRLPPQALALQDLVAFVDSRVPTPPWWPLKDRLFQRARGLFDRHVPAEDLEWGTFGPRALTHVLGRHGLTGHALDSDVFYPILWYETALFFRPPEQVVARFTERTVAVHLWSSGSLLATPEMKGVRSRPPALDSWIADQCRALDVMID